MRQKAAAYSLRSCLKFHAVVFVLHTFNYQAADDVAHPMFARSPYLAPKALTIRFFRPLFSEDVSIGTAGVRL